MAARLVFRDSVGREGVVELNSSEPVYIGRALECSIRTDDGMVSRRNSQITFEDGKFVIEDLRSANGTRINGMPVQRQALANNDVIAVGTLTITFMELAAAPVAAPQPPRVAPAPVPAPSASFSEDAPTSSIRPVSGRMPALAAAPPSAPPASAPVAQPPPLPGPALPYGGPPPMPAAQARGKTPSVTPDGGIFAKDAPSAAPRDDQRRAAGAAGAGPTPNEDRNVLVDLGLEHDAGKSAAEIKQLKAELEKATANYEREVADSKRLRAEAVALRDRIEELRTTVKDRDDQVAAHDRASDELRDDLQSARDELAKVRGELETISETVAAKDRALGRAQDDVTKMREETDDLNKQLMEVMRIKDEGWRKLNEQLTEIDQLRDVINEQVRLLEERRIGLISQEEVIKDLRAERERTHKTIAQLKAERDDAATHASRAAANIVALEEENKRLGRLLVEAQTDGGRTGSGDQTVRLMSELKDLRVDFKRVEADRERLEDIAQREEQTRMRLEARVATLEVDLSEMSHAKLTAESARNIAQEALAKAEVARHKAVEEALLAQKAKDNSAGGIVDGLREADKLRKRVAELEASGDAAGKLREATEKLALLEKQLRTAVAEADAAKTDALKARAEAARAKAMADASAVEVIERGRGREPEGAVAGLAERAMDVYRDINDILSEMRNNVVLVQEEMGQVSDPVRQAVAALVVDAESAKTALRSLRELAEKK